MPEEYHELPGLKKIKSDLEHQKTLFLNHLIKYKSNLNERHSNIEIIDHLNIDLSKKYINNNNKKALSQLKNKNKKKKQKTNWIKERTDDYIIRAEIKKRFNELHLEMNDDVINLVPSYKLIRARRKSIKTLFNLYDLDHKHDKLNLRSISKKQIKLKAEKLIELDLKSKRELEKQNKNNRKRNMAIDNEEEPEEEEEKYQDDPQSVKVRLNNGLSKELINSDKGDCQLYDHYNFIKFAL